MGIVWIFPIWEAGFWANWGGEAWFWVNWGGGKGVFGLGGFFTFFSRFREL